MSPALEGIKRRGDGPMVVPRISNPNSREALNRHSIKSFTPPLADHNIDSVALTLLSDSSRLGLRRRKEETHAGTHRADLIFNSSFTARFGGGITQATTPIWFVPHHEDPRRNELALAADEQSKVA